MNKEFLKKCWKHPRWHSLMVLMIWIVSLTLLMGIVSLVNQFSPQKKKEEIPQMKTNEISLEEKWNCFLKEDYTFYYLVTTETETVKYEGAVNKGITTGYRERLDGIIRYSIEDNLAYEMVLDEKKELTTLYENIDASLLDLSHIETLIQNIPVANSDILEEDKKITYEYTVTEENLKIMVITDEAHIKNILIVKENETYSLSFDF